MNASGYTCLAILSEGIDPLSEFDPAEFAEEWTILEGRDGTKGKALSESQVRTAVDKMRSSGIIKVDETLKIGVVF